MGSPNASITWHVDALPKNAQQALKFLSTQEWLKKSSWYLAGGTALALQVGHRRSLDLDFFYPKSSFSLAELVESFPKDIWEADIAKEGTVYGRLHGAKASFIAYPFFKPQEPPVWYGHVRVLVPRDLAVMKIIAMSQRGKKRDFVDLYWYIQHYEPLKSILERVPAQYPTVTHDAHHILKSCMYFADAEADPMPELYFKASWPTIKSYFLQEVPKVAKQLLKL